MRRWPIPSRSRRFSLAGWRAGCGCSFAAAIGSYRDFLAGLTAGGCGAARSLATRPLIPRHGPFFALRGAQRWRFAVDGRRAATGETRPMGGRRYASPKAPRRARQRSGRSAGNARCGCRCRFGGGAPISPSRTATEPSRAPSTLPGELALLEGRELALPAARRHGERARTSSSAAAAGCSNSARRRAPAAGRSASRSTAPKSKPPKRTGAAHQRAWRGARKHSRRGRDLWRRQAAQILQFGLCAAVGLSRRTGSPASPRSTSCWSGCASAAGCPEARRFPRLQAAADRAVHLADRAAERAAASARRAHPQLVGLAASARRADLRL